ncbi:universal stress protein [Dehalogenimonas etheniformans]|uniref:Universal stress protein n=1 Tax=Dehalogenimonas etheniformans TaxID=1536648 RepID=A0A2P5PA98_9CHLR|nr:universal stress protein [Dehalogenimonas etheniformans]PPD59221.1 universal stress protein [Dehalogenimonas etheniformans]QNT75737.1 universal stress protein [Dehalogenimonas etheniformans]
MYNKILVCLDGSKLAEQILPYVEAQAVAFKSNVELIQVVTFSGKESQNHPTTYLELLQMAEADARLYLECVADSLRKKGIKVGCVVLNTTPVGFSIVNYAQTVGSLDLIALATHGHGGLGILLMGSVADYVLQKAGLPLLVIKPS